MRKASIIRFPQREVAKYRSDGMRDLIRGSIPLVQHNKRIPGAQQTLPVPDGCSSANPSLTGGIFLHSFSPPH